MMSDRPTGARVDLTQEGSLRACVFRNVRVSLLVTCVLWACGVPQAQNTPPAAVEAVRAMRVLTLVRTKCLGRCPAYRVAVDDDGKVTFEGKAYVALVGHAEWRVDPDIAARLIARMRALCAEGSCLEPEGCGALDAPQAGVRLTLPEGQQTIVTCSAPTDASGSWIMFENEIDRALGTSSYVAIPRAPR